MPSVSPLQQVTTRRSSSPPPQLPPLTEFHTLLTEDDMNFEAEDGDGEQSAIDGDADGNLPSPSDSGADERSVAPSLENGQPDRPLTPPSPTPASVADPKLTDRAAPAGKTWLPALHPSSQPRPNGGVAPPPIVEEGIWTVSVAEAKGHEGEAYTIYVKTPTHHLTLTRSTTEVRELEAKLNADLPGHRLPVSPLHKYSNSPSSTLSPTSPQPRKRSFLTTVSRLVSPSRNQSPTFGPRSRHHHSHLHPSEANVDPTALAQYLTTLSNDPYVRTAKPWRRFVRVRVDDLESRRVERRVRRTRSDLAAHRAGKSGIGSIGGGVSGSRTAPPNGKLLKEMMEESEEEVVQDAEPVKKKPAEREVDTYIGGEVGALPALVEATPAEEGGIPPIEVHADLLDPVESTDSTAAEPPQPTPTLPTHNLEPTLTPIVRAAPLSLTPPATPKVTPAQSYSYISDPIPLAQLPPRPASADPDSAVRHHRVWTPMTPLNHQPSETDIAETTEDDEADAAAATGEEGITGEEGEQKKLSEGGKKRGKGKKIRIEDYEMLRVLGKGCAGKVLLVKYRATGSLYALKAITKRHVLAHQELQHTLTEQAVLKRMAAAGENANPFVVKLYWSFHDRENLFLVMDFHPGGDLATQLARWGRLGRDRARFYAAEIVEGVEGLHAAGVIYRDLKPENILIGVDGHIVLTDFGLSKEFPKRAIQSVNNMTNSSSLYSAPGTPRSGSPFWGAASGYGDSTANFWGGRKDRDVTSTFCGTAEYLAPEVIQGLPYSYEVDWWSFGTMLYEMLTGITPFWANNHADMYVRVLQDELCFPDDKAMDQDTKSLIRGLLQRNPALRMSEPRIKKHPYFQMIDWSHVYHKRYIPPYIPPIDPSNESDTQNFDETFLDMEPVISDEPDESERERHDDPGTGTDTAETETSSVRTAGIESGVEPEDEPDLFDGYSYKARHSMTIEADEESIIEEPYTGEDGTTSSGVRTSGTNTDDSRFTLDSGVTASTAPTSVEEEVTATLSAPDLDSISESPTDINAPTSAPDTAGTVTPAEPSSRQPKEQPKEGEDVAKTSAPAPIVTPSSPKPAVVRRVEIRTPIEPALTEALPTTPAKPTVTKTARFKPVKPKEKSGIPALDRDFTPSQDDFDDDWDLVETPHGEEANGMKGTSLFARGVVDRYRLAVFRRPNSGKSSRTPSSHIIGEGSDGTASPSPSDGKIRRGRSTGLSIRKSTNQFLRPKSPVSQGSTSAMASLTSSGVALGGGNHSRVTPPTSFHMNSSSSQLPSRTSIGSPDSSQQSLHSTEGLPRSNSEPFSERGRPTSPQSREKHKNLTKMKKITEQGAEKVLSLFHSQHQR